MRSRIEGRKQKRFDVYARGGGERVNRICKREKTNSARTICEDPALGEFLDSFPPENDIRLTAA